MVKTYRGEAMSELLKRIRTDLGDHAVVLETRELHTDVGYEIDVAVLCGHAHHQKETSVQSSDVRLSSLRDALTSQEAPMEFISTLFAAPPLCDPEAFADTHELLTMAIEYLYTFDASLELMGTKIAFVGSTGAGKTSCVAKLALSLHRRYGVRVGVIDLLAGDAHTESPSLSALASVLHLPVAVLSTAHAFKRDLSAALRAFNGCDVVIFDTPGYASIHGKESQLLQSALREHQIEQFLVLTPERNDCAGWSTEDISRIVLGKFESYAAVAGMLLQAFQVAKPIAFLSSSKGLARGLEVATSRRLASQLLRFLH